MIFLQLSVLLICIFIGSRMSGIGLGVIEMVGLLISSFLFAGYTTLLTTIQFDRTGTTKIGKYVLNGQLRNDLADHQVQFAHYFGYIDDFAEAVIQIRPNAIIGVSTVGSAFNQQVIENMSLINERPIIFPYSNPTSHAECTAEQAYTWSKGKAVFDSGSPFAPVTYEGKTFTSGQGNNVFIFPSMGLAIFATEAKRVTDEMFITAAEAVAEQVTQVDFEKGLIYPQVKDIMKVSLNVAVKIAEEIFKSGLAGIEKPKDLQAFIKSKMYVPEYK